MSATPTWLPCDPAGIPRELTDRKAWYPAIIRPKANKPGKYDKIPGDPATGQKAKWSDKATRRTFGEAFMAYQSGRFPGVGYMMDADAGVIGIDLDDSVNPDRTIKPWAQEIVDSFPGAYWELSISGTGLRGFCLGTLPVGGCRSKIEGSSVELYADERYLVVTGQALEPVEALPTLQAAVDRLHARLTAGRVRATGTAVVTGMTGPNADPSPEAFAIVEELMGGRHAAQLSEIWGRDDLHASGVNEQDWALEKEAVKAAMARGYDGEDLARIVEEVLRAGPYRKKWDEKRGAVTWLAQDIANAIETVKEEHRKAPRLVLKGDDAPADPFETPEQIIARLEGQLAHRDRELALERANSAVQQTVIRSLKARLEVLEPIVTAVDEVLQRPDKELGSDDKVAAIALARWLPFHYSKQAANGERPRVSLAYLAKVVGMPSRRLSRSIDRLSADTPDAGAPFGKQVTRRPKVDQDNRPIVDPETGRQLYESRFEVWSWTPTATATLQTTARYETPERPGRGGSKAASDVRWGRCPKHEAADVVAKGVCADCGLVLGERRMRAADFEALPQNVQNGHSDVPLATPVVERPLVGVQNGHSGHANGAARRQNLQVVDSDPAFDDFARLAVATPIGSDRTNGDYARANGDSGVSRLQPNGHARPEASAELDDGITPSAPGLPPMPPEWLFDADHETRMRWVREEL